MAREPSASHRARGWVRFENRLWLAAMPEQRNADPDQLYAVRGILWMNGRPIRVSLECSMWSDTVSQLAVRPAGLAWPVRTDRFGRRAVQVLEDVVGAVMGTAVLRRARNQQSQIAMPRSGLSGRRPDWLRRWVITALDTPAIGSAHDYGSEWWSQLAYLSHVTSVLSCSG